MTVVELNNKHNNDVILYNVVSQPKPGSLLITNTTNSTENSFGSLYKVNGNARSFFGWMTFIHQDVCETDLQIEKSELEQTRSETLIKSSEEFLHNHKAEIAIKYWSTWLLGIDGKLISGMTCKTEEIESRKPKKTNGDKSWYQKRKIKKPQASKQSSTVPMMS